MEVGTWLRSLALDDLTAPVARFSPVALRDGIVWEPTGASATEQGVVDDAPVKLLASEAATAR